MKIIVSRKGFDSKNGGVPSPIFENGRMVSLPIPYPRDKTTFRDVRYGGRNLGQLVEDLTRKRIRRTHTCHLDPDLRKNALRHRPPGWRPAFGQCDKAETHLRDEGVACGDLFLFFGSFRSAKEGDAGFVFEPNSLTQQVIFGWLQVGEVYRPIPLSAELPRWAKSHPHASYSWSPFYSVTGREERNSIYVARRSLDIPGLSGKFRGAGVFRRYHQDLCLTWPGKSKGRWRLPSWMYPFGRTRREPMSFHCKSKKDGTTRWTRVGKSVLLETAPIGQEFVIDCAEYPNGEVNQWLRMLFRHVR